MIERRMVSAVLAVAVVSVLLSFIVGRGSPDAPGREPLEEAEELHSRIAGTEGGERSEIASGAAALYEEALAEGDLGPAERDSARFNLGQVRLILGDTAGALGEWDLLIAESSDTFTRMRTAKTMADISSLEGADSNEAGYLEMVIELGEGARGAPLIEEMVAEARRRLAPAGDEGVE